MQKKLVKRFGKSVIENRRLLDWQSIIKLKTALWPLLSSHFGKDRLIPDGKKHANTYMNWAKGETELKYYPDGTHVCANYLDETDAYMIDWLRKH